MSVKPMLDAATAKRDKRQQQIKELLAKPQADNRTELTAEEAERFTKLAADLTELEERTIPEFEKQLQREEKAATASAEVKAETEKRVGGATITSEPGVYDLHSKRNGSYFVDLGVLAAASARLGGFKSDPQEALARMQRNAREVEVEVRKLDTRARAAFEEFLSVEGGSYETRVNPNTTAGTGGEFVPPLWLVSQYVPFVRPGRVAANRCKNMPLPPGIDVINIPKITVKSLTAIQTANAAAVASQDIQTSTVSAPVRTIAGQEDISLQLLEQSPLAMDGVIFDDLSRDYDQQLDVQVIQGSGANGQHTGVLSLAGGTSNTSITQANFINSTATAFYGTAAGQYPSVVNGVNQIETLRFNSDNLAIWAHPRRVNSWALAADTTNRPLFIPAKYGQFNTLGTNEGQPTYQGVAGELYGMPVVKDANLPTTVNGFTGTAVNLTGGNQDPVVVVKEDDLYLWEGTLRMRALPEILSGTLQIRYQVYAYSAFLPSRFPPSVSVIAGAGVASPSF